MKRFFMMMLMASLSSWSIGQVLINEVDYDDASTDDLEFIELLNTTGSPIDLSSGDAGGDGYYLVLVNGSGGAIYEQFELTGTIPANGFYVVIANNGSTRTGADQGNTGSGSFGSVQNGAPDGVALVLRSSGSDTLLDSISYEHASGSNDYTSDATDGGLSINFEFGTNGINALDATDGDSVQRILGANNANDKTQWHPIAVGETYDAANPSGSNFSPSIVEYSPFPTLPTSTDDILVFARVTDPENDTLTVTADMTLQGGGTSNATLLDDGVSPDETAGDDIYSGSIPAFGGADDGKTLTFVIHANDGTNPTVDSDPLIITIDDNVTPGTIAAARAATLGDLVYVNGISNNGKGVYNDNTFYLQDATGGINNFDTNIDVVPNSLIPLGADVTVYGRRSHSFGDSNTLSDVQLGEVTAAEGYDFLAIRVNSTGNPVPEPQVVTTGDLEANILDYEGELVRVNNVAVASGTWPTPPNSGQFEINDGSGDTTCYIDGDAGLAQRTDTAFGYIIGVASSQQIGGPERDPRLLPRFDSDLELATAAPWETWSLYE